MLYIADNNYTSKVYFQRKSSILSSILTNSGHTLHITLETVVQSALHGPQPVLDNLNYMLIG
jgi:hypothetical protein